MSSLEALLKYFPSGTAEGEDNILEEVFIYTEEFRRIISPPQGSPHLLIGSKGSGKSALLRFSKKVLSQEGIPAILLTPAEIDTSSIGNQHSTGDMRRLFGRSILSGIAARLVTEKFSLDDDQNAITYAAMDAQESSGPAYIRFGSFLSEIAKPLVKIDFAKAFPKLLQTTKTELEHSISRVIGNRGFYLFIDDTDQVANPEVPGHLNRIWALILSARDLCGIIPTLRVVISLRGEVWDRLRTDSAGQRDQTDHFNSLIVSLQTSEPHVQKILERRMSVAASNLGSNFLTIYDPFFEGQAARPPNSTAPKLWKDLIVRRSRNRPRDAIQLVNKMARYAIANSKPRIDESSFQSVMPEFSESVVMQLGQDFERECPQTIEIIRKFASFDYDAGGFTLSTNSAKEYCSKILTSFGIDLYGVRLKQQSDDDIYALWRFLYMIDFLNARRSDTTMPKGYIHLDPQMDSKLVSRARWNDMQKVTWEINPAYRDFLIARQTEDRRFSGLAKKTRGRRR